MGFGLHYWDPVGSGMFGVRIWVAIGFWRSGTVFPGKAVGLVLNPVQGLSGRGLVRELQAPVAPAGCTGEVGGDLPNPGWSAEAFGGLSLSGGGELSRGGST